MKKLLVAVMALTMVNAFANDHGGHSMVKLDGCFDGGRCDNLDFYMSSDDADAKEEIQTIALNYAHSWDMWGVGATYKTHKETNDGDVTAVGDDMNMMGLSFYWNKDGGWTDSCFVALHYNLTTVEDTDATKDSGRKENDIVLEYGHRYGLGKAMMGVQINYVPSITYTMTETEYNDDNKDNLNATELRLNFANFAAVF